ncbi:nuclear pore complex protein Nup160 homolog [Pollicipes pollicipes]|uniref:nuclear pore complex protein Nup160 homolog n=1 Tax=Pollicipes pollicipes TaxID=41117 RepID=UPI001884C7CA|nr:nuclear pore complex protein Nup160 homolog [Pollicipes pollicipes]
MSQRGFSGNVSPDLHETRSEDLIDHEMRESENFVFCSDLPLSVPEQGLDKKSFSDLLDRVTPEDPFGHWLDESVNLEVYPNLSHSVVWENIVINTGASHGTLQDIKLPEYSGGHTFVACGVRRSLFWRVNHDTLELTEESTDVDILNGHLRLHFRDSPILEGITAHETRSALVLLLATVSSVHRLRLELPSQPAGQQPTSVTSLLHQLSAKGLRQPDAMHVLEGQANAPPPPHTAASWLLPSGEAVFLLAAPGGGGQVVHYLGSGPGPLAASHELQTGSMVGRLFGFFSDSSQQRVDAVLVLPGAVPLFVLVRAAEVRGAWQLEHEATVCAPDHDLIDFALTEDALWALWTTAEAETQLRYWPLSADAPPPAVHVTASTHLSQAYLRHIFHPGRFQTSTIQRAVSIYSRSECTETEGLRAAVVATVEAEIQQSASDYQLAAAEYHQLALAAWDAFYSACLQYHQVATKPLGLSVDPASAQVAVVRQAFVSYVRPADLVEQLWLAEPAEPEDGTQRGADPRAEQRRLVQCCRLLETHISTQLAAAVRQDLAHLQTPDAIALSVVDAISEEPEFAEFRDLLAERVRGISHLTDALSTLLTLLQVRDSELPPTAVADQTWFSSRLGGGLLAASVEQSLRVRFSLSLDLVLLETLMLKLARRCGLTGDEEMELSAKFLPETVIQVQAYFALLWLVETPAEPVSGDRQEGALRQLAALCVEEASPLLPALATAVTRLVWPVSRQSALPELLLATCQHAALREYVRLHQAWCDWNSASRCLLLGLALLNLGQPDKACDMFVSSADAVGKDEPLLVRLLRLEPAADEPHSRLLVRYYLRIIQLLELHQLPDWVLELATAGIDVALDDDPNVATLWSIVFKYRLRLGHVTEAYAAMNSNPEQSRRRDCLRQLVVTLHERRDLATLVRLPYVDMLHDVVTILEGRARASEPLTSRFYDVLYAFHVHRDNYRKAGTVMYECGRRLAGEPDGLQRQAECYSACVNALQLVKPEYAWIVRPEGEAGDGAGGVAVLTLDEIRREAQLVAARHAMQVARAHQLSAEPVARELAAALAAGAGDGTAWQWLGRNELPLELRRDTPVYAALHEGLSGRLQAYQQTLGRVSADMAAVR